MQIEAANTIFYCSRWHECVEFYRTGLALPVTFENDWFVEFTLNSGARMSVADAARASIGSAAGQGVTLTLKVADLEVARSSLASRGLSPGSVTEHAWGARVFYLFDPDNHRIEFWSDRADP